MPSPKIHRSRSAKSSAGFWKRQARIWHWMSGAVCLIGIVLFSITGITLNHAHQIPASPKTSVSEATLPSDILFALKDQPVEGVSMGLPGSVGKWLRQEMKVSTRGRRVEWTEVDAYIGLPSPGGDAWLSIDRETGQVFYEVTRRGAVAYLNDLHKGRNTGQVWFWFLDVFAAACVVFCLTGLWLLQIHAGKRPSTWPLTLVGLALPALIAIFFIH